MIMMSSVKFDFASNFLCILWKSNRSSPETAEERHDCCVHQRRWGKDWVVLDWPQKEGSATFATPNFDLEGRPRGWNEFTSNEGVGAACASANELWGRPHFRQAVKTSITNSLAFNLLIIAISGHSSEDWSDDTQMGKRYLIFSSKKHNTNNSKWWNIRKWL